MAVQALLAPGDIVIVDRNCHKSHHYGHGAVGGAAALRRSISDDGIFDVWRGPAEDHQAGAAEPQIRGQAEPGQDARPDQLHFRRPRLQYAPGDGGCLAIKPDSSFLWDEAWFAFARFSPFLRRGRAWALPTTSRPGCMGRIALRFAPVDFKSKTRDGIGDDWPISYEDIAPYYDKVESYIGVFGSQENVSSAPNGIFLPPPKPRCHERLVKQPATS